MKAFVGIVLLAASAWGRNALYLDISGQWKFADGDDPAFSRRPAAEIAKAALAWGQNDDITVVTVRRAEC
jgi:hypothetical protein